MFDIGWTELLIIAVVAIIVVGPKDLPAMLRTLGRYAGKMKRTASEFRSQFDDALRDSELDELRSTISDVGKMNPVNQIRDSVTESLDPLKETADSIRGDIEDAGRSTGGSEPATGTTETPKKSSAETADGKTAAKDGPPVKKPAASNQTGKAAKKDADKAAPAAQEEA